MTQTESIVDRDIFINARPDAVYPYLIDPALMMRWMGKDVRLDPVSGGEYYVNINDRNIASGTFVEAAPAERVVFTFGWVGESDTPPGSSTVEITLKPEGDGTRLRLRHLGLAAGADVPHTQGWDHYLSRIAIAAAGGDAGPDAMAM